MSAYADELLDGHRELVAEAGTTITLDQATTSYGVVLVFPEASSDTEHAGRQARGMDGVEIERAFFTAAGITHASRFRITGQSLLLHVTGIEDDPGSPIIYFSAEEVQ